MKVPYDLRAIDRKRDLVSLKTPLVPVSLQGDHICQHNFFAVRHRIYVCRTLNQVMRNCLDTNPKPSERE